MGVLHRWAGWALGLLAGVGPALAQPGDTVRGRALFESRCVGCHSLDHDRAGPALGHVVGRLAGKHPGFVYSNALAAANHVWTPGALQAWLANPDAVVPGQAMGYQVPDATDRQDVVAFLVSLAAGPGPGPAAPSNPNADSRAGR